MMIYMKNIKSPKQKYLVGILNDNLSLRFAGIECYYAHYDDIGADVKEHNFNKSNWNIY